MAKNKFILPLIVFMALAEISPACEFHNFFGGTNPLYTRNVTGFRYRMRNVVFDHDAAMEALGGEHHAGGTLCYGELWGRFYLTKKTIAWVNLPLFFNPGQNTWLGDPSVLMQRQIFSIDPAEGKNFSFRWYGGAGVKFPSPVQRTIDPDAQFITSTGSFDALISSTLVVNYKKIGITSDVSYKINMPNKQQFKYGNVTNLNLAAFYRRQINNVKIIPGLSLYSELASDNETGNIVQANSGYKNLYAGASVDVFFRNFTCGISAQQLAASSESNLHEWRLQAGFAFSFGN